MRRFWTFISMALLLAAGMACQDKAATTQLEEFRAQSDVEARNTALVTQGIEELNSGNIDAYLDCLAPEYTLYSPSNSPNPVSKEEMAGFAGMLFKAFPDIHYAIKDILAVEDRVVLWNIVTGTHEGEFQGIPATGNKVEVGSIILFRIREGKIVEEREEFDTLGLMMQLGMELKS